jgi:hypothetical protein
MRESVFPIPSFGSLEFYANVLASEGVRFANEEKLSKQNKRNRYLIPGPNKVQTLTIPIKKPFNGVPLNEIQISNAEDWQKLHWHTLLTAYGKSPFFEFYDYKLEKLYKRQYDHLLNFNMDAMEFCLQALKTDLTFETATNPSVTNEFKEYNLQPYIQVFSEKFGFVKEVCVLDAIFNLGPDAGSYLAEATAFSS